MNPHRVDRLGAILFCFAKPDCMGCGPVVQNDNLKKYIRVNAGSFIHYGPSKFKADLVKIVLYKMWCNIIQF